MIVPLASAHLPDNQLDIQEKIHQRTRLHTSLKNSQTIWSQNGMPMRKFPQTQTIPGFPQHPLTVSSSTILVLSNLAIIFIALLAHWSILTLLWGYWLQSLIIGFFNGLKLLMFGQQRTPQQGFLHSIKTSLYFFGHYGLFHCVYLLLLFFLCNSANTTLHFTPPDLSAIALIGFLFFLNHCYSFAQHYLWEKQIVVISSSNVFLDPYKRIFPMHLSIIAAGFFSALIPSAQQIFIIIFLILKTFADLKSHEILHQTDTYRTFHHHA
jgi:hypothetical protein